MSELKLILKPTATMKTVNGASCRLWEGETGDGKPCFAMIALVGFDLDVETNALEKSLKRVKVHSTVRLPMSLGTES